ncbi:hypothetical protein HL653_10960 [Sphingomonas sp. AP4-R1]|uniref:hypothetical protein n=1 Tax=Sphingomonas sp. AP4-R1 TaxID=2735134 RepID=UPI001493B6D0|nr:hypothetical protein [Sphingomonas sp. AP4-R1]QJU58240.1 hypothetical protein HL653_10960 [Sphingomonas sp. AP4-R1]
MAVMIAVIMMVTAASMTMIARVAVRMALGVCSRGAQSEAQQHRRCQCFIVCR